MTDEQKFLFDVRGWPLIPGVLEEATIEAVKAHLYAGWGRFHGAGAGAAGPSRRRGRAPGDTVRLEAFGGGLQLPVRKLLRDHPPERLEARLDRRSPRGAGAAAGERDALPVPGRENLLRPDPRRVGVEPSGKEFRRHVVPLRKP